MQASLLLMILNKYKIHCYHTVYHPCTILSLNLKLSIAAHNLSKFCRKSIAIHFIPSVRWREERAWLCLSVDEQVLTFQIWSHSHPWINCSISASLPSGVFSYEKISNILPQREHTRFNIKHVFIYIFQRMLVSYHCIKCWVPAPLVTRAM